MTNPYGTWTLFKRETHRFMKVYLQTIFAPVVSNLLYLAIFGLSLKRAISIEGIEYLQFLVPGLIMMGIINNAYQNPSSSMIIMKYQGTAGDLMNIPLKRAEIFSAFIASAVLRGFIVGSVTYLTALYFVGFDYVSIPIIFLASLLVSILFATFGMAVGIVADDFDKQAFIFNFILTPLIFLGGVFYPVTRLPGIFQTLAQVNPIVYMIDLLRYGFTGVHEFDLTLSLAILTAITLISAIVAYSILRSGYKLQT